MAKTGTSTVDDYIASQPDVMQKILRRVRGAIRRAVPKAEELISYKIPAYKLNNRVLIYFAAWQHHYSIYPAGERLVAAFRAEMGALEVSFSKGTIRFPLSQPVPVKLIGKIARFRAKEISAPKKRAPKKS